MTRSLVRTLLSLPALMFLAHTALAQGMAIDIGQTVVKKQIAQGVSMDDAVDSMKLRANQLNMKLVAEQPLSKQIEAMEQKSRRMEIFQFCDPLIAKQMVEYDMNFAAYLPCRITLVEDKDGHGWLVMMNLDMFLQGTHLPPELKKLGTEVRDKLNSIMDAGAKGEL